MSHFMQLFRLSLTFRVSSGGFRRLVGTRTHATQHYTGEDAVSTVAFHVDTGEPVYNSPSDAFQIHPDLTKVRVFTVHLTYIRK